MVSRYTGAVSWLDRLLLRRAPVTETVAVDDLYRSLLLHVNPEPLYSSAVARFGEIAGCEAVALFLLDSERGDLCLHARIGTWPETFVDSRWAIESGLARWLAINEQPLLVARSREVVADLPEEQTRLIRESPTAVIVPLEAANHLTGFLCFGPTCDRRGWTEQRAGRVATLAVPAALAFEHAVMVQEAESRLRRLYRAERLATAGTLAAGMAHEVRNPLTAIRSGIQLVRDRDDIPAEAVEVLQEAICEVDRIDRLVGGLLMFARAPRASSSEIDLVEVVRRALALVEGRARRQGLTLVSELPAQQLVRGDPGQLEQVVLNLLLNAIEAIAGEGTVTISLAAPEPGSQVVLLVHDSGPGVDESLGEQVFDPFVTTKREGSGLGLPISSNIVRQHGGELSLTSLAERGAVARVVLPRRQEGS